MLEWFTRYGYVFLFFGLLGEYVALPFPGDLTLALAGVLSHHGKLNFGLAAAVGFSGTALGMTITYWIGRGLGKPFLLRYGSYIALSPERVERGMRWIDQFGLPLLAVGYFLPGVRHFTGYLSGAMGIPFRHFAAAAYAGALAWVMFFLTLGKLLGPKWDVYAPLVERYSLPLGLVLLAVTTSFVLARFLWNPARSWWTHFLREANATWKAVRRFRLLLYTSGAILAGMSLLLFKLVADLWSRDVRETDALVYVLVQGALEEFPRLTVLSRLEDLSRPEFLFFVLFATSACVVWRGREKDLELVLLLGTFGGTLGGLWVFPRIFALAFASLDPPVEFAAPAFVVLSFLSFAAYLSASFSPWLWLRGLLGGAFAVLVGGTFFADLAFSPASWSGVVASGMLGALWSVVHVVFYEAARIWRTERRRVFLRAVREVH
ncbi:MAG: DedA family protein [Brockia lithotrophica]|nr:DedA family protein [Brockia lithotrophica]